MQNLKVWQKLALMGVVFTVPLAVVIWRMASVLDTLGAETARQERLGLEYYTPTLALLRDLQQHRGLSVAVASGDASFKAPLASKKAELDVDLKNIDEADRRLGSGLKTSEKWAALSAACRNLLNATNLSASDTFDRHTKVIGTTMTLIDDVADSSQLILDPSLDTYYLMNFLILTGPELGEVLAQARGLGTGVAAGRNTTPAQLETLNRLAVLATFLHTGLDESLGRMLTFNEPLRPQLEAEVRDSSAAIGVAVAHITKMASGKADTSATDYYATMNRSVTAIYDLQHHVAGSLDVLLQARVVRLERVMFVTVAGAALGLLLVTLIGSFMMRDITVSLRRVVDTANRIATGDLVVPTISLSRKDELGGLARAFDRMVLSLKETAAVAERIAAGDLAVVVTPRSERDVLGNSLANMVDRLSTLVGEVKRSGLQVNASVNEIAATSREQQATASEIAATTSQIGATSKEISATSRELVKTMSEVSIVAEHSAALAGSGQVGLTRMEATMRHVMDAAGTINAKLAILSDKAGDITHVVTTITKVADQTNLLSLNAAIEAEKAGEYGRGFAVVATEIRRLADQTAVATYDIDQMVKQIQSAVSAGVMGMDKFSEEVRRGMQEVQQVGGQLSQIIHQVQALAPRCEAVNEGMEAQASGAEQISQALGQLSEAAQHTVESLRQSGQAIDGLHEAATGMRNGVSRFNLAA